LDAHTPQSELHPFKEHQQRFAEFPTVPNHYMTTQQGDITRIEDVNGNVLATYEYDAWGKLISSSGSLSSNRSSWSLWWDGIRSQWGHWIHP